MLILDDFPDPPSPRAFKPLAGPPHPWPLICLPDIRRTPPAYCGPAVYFLWADFQLLYIGQTRTQAYRIRQHQDAQMGFRQANCIPFNSVSYMAFEPVSEHYYTAAEDSQRLAVERQYIRKYLPPYNHRIPS